MESSDAGLLPNHSYSTKPDWPPNDTMSSIIKWRKGWLFIGTGIVVVFIVIWLLSTFGQPINRFKINPITSSDVNKDKHVNWFMAQGYDVWPAFSERSFVTNTQFKRDCVKNGNFSITGLSSLIAEWGNSNNHVCHLLHKTFLAMFSVEARKAHLSIPNTFKAKVSGWLKNDAQLVKEVYDQDVIHVVSRFTREHTIYNPLRDKRPVSPPEIPEQKYVDDIVNRTASTCDFCKFKEMTAEHEFGRVETMYAFSASNVFKLDTLHALLALKNHHPLKWNRDQFLDLMGLSLRWLNKAKLHHKIGKYPSLIWDIFPHCGASQVHPHVQAMFDPSRYHGVIESWREAAQDYKYSFNSNYFTDLVSLYSALGLTATYGSAVAFANLVPRKDHEVVVMSKEADNDFFTLLYFTLRGFVDDLHVYCYSMGMGYPAFGEDKGRIPAFARIITRGAVTDNRADMSSLELFTATNVNIDPWKTIQVVRDSVKKRSNMP